MPTPTKTLETLEREAAALEEEKKRTAAQTEKPRSMPGWQARCPARLPCRARRQFGDFSRRVGVANIAELEEKHFSQVQEALDAEIAETKKQLAAEQAKLAGINRSITTRGEEIAMKVPNVLENCKMESVELPAAESEGGGAGASGARATRCSCRCR